MKLSEFITNEFINKNHNKELCLIRIKDFNYDENDFECNRYDSDIVKSIAFILDNGLLDMEVEEVTDEDNVLEVWIR